MEKLQNHKDNEVYQQAYDVIGKYFSDGEAENMATNQRRATVMDDTNDDDFYTHRLDLYRKHLCAERLPPIAPESSQTKTPESVWKEDLHALEKKLQELDASQ